MSRDWDYAQHSHEVALGGGPEKFLETIKNSSFEAGKLEGLLEGRTEGQKDLLIAEGIVVGIGALGLLGYKAYKTVKNRKTIEKIDMAKEEVNKATEEYLDAMKGGEENTLESPSETVQVVSDL